MSAENMAKEEFLSKKTNNKNAAINTIHVKLIKNLTTILFHINTSTSIVATSVPTATFQKHVFETVHLINHIYYRTHVYPSDKEVNRIEKFTSLHKVFLELKEENPVSKYKYSSRVAPMKITSESHILNQIYKSDSVNSG